MTDEEAAAQGPQDGGPNTQPPLDGILVGLVYTANKFPGTEFGVTLYVNGLIVSGILISLTTYLELVPEMIRRSAPGNAAGEVWARLFDMLRGEDDPAQESVSASEGQGSEAEASEVGFPALIHLRDARIWAPNGAHDLAPAIWRGRLDHVSGWALGTLGQSPA